MEVAFAGQQSFAQQQLRTLERAAFGKFTRAGEQHVFDEVRMVEQIKMLAAGAEINNVAIITGEVGEKLQRIALQKRQSQSEKLPRRARRTCVASHAQRV